ncbi:MAG: VWA domain-containing protein [Bacteroidales bacterium]|jgi:Ca-activated chloride channel family protein|nr:VWA domain-containing protein [Bacteroidales bacterium]
MFGIDEFANKNLLWLLTAIIPLIVWYVLYHPKTDAVLKTSGLKAFAGIPSSGRVSLRHMLFVLQMLAFALFVIALARPQKSNSWKTVDTEGIDVMIALDISGSMLAEDFKPNRLEAAKDVAIEFIADRPNDRIGLVVFAGESFTQCPLTTNHKELVRLFREVDSDMLADGTAIGMGLASAVNRLKDSKVTSKVVILLTDGVNNSGQISPETAAEIAKTFELRVYSIGVGSKGTAPYPVQTPFGTQYQNMEVKIDESTLSAISEMTGGQYFRATDNEKLREIYQEIDQLEKTIIQEKQYTQKDERFFWFLFAGIVLLVVQLILRYTVFRQIP